MSSSSEVKLSGRKAKTFAVLAIMRSILSPAAAINGTAKQQSNSFVRVSLICKIRSNGFSNPDTSAGPPARIRFMKTPFS